MGGKCRRRHARNGPGAPRMLALEPGQKTEF
jgi:hypothetical protein